MLVSVIIVIAACTTVKKVNFLRFHIFFPYRCLQSHISIYSQQTGLLLSICVHIRLGKDNSVHWDALCNDTEVCALAGLISRHILQLRCNVHAITAVHPQGHADDPGRKVETTEQVRVASAVYPTVSLMNHGCDPNVIARYVSKPTFQ